MTFTVIDNPDFHKFVGSVGFKNAEFKQLAGLFHQGASRKVLYDIAVDVDFEGKSATFSYFQSASYQPFLRFIIRQVGPNTLMYELYQEGKGRIAKSGLFSRTFDRLKSEIDKLIPSS